MRKLFILTFCVSFAVGALSQTDTTAIFDKANTLNEQGDKFYDEKKYPEALNLYKQAAEITKNINDGNNNYYATSLFNIAWVYYSTEDYMTAIEYFNRVIAVIEEKDLRYAKCLNSIGVSYENIGDYQNALKYYMQAFENKKNILGEGPHLDYAISFTAIGYIYSATGEYQNALKYYTQAMEIRKKALGEEHPEYIKTLNYIAYAYDCMFDYQNALKYKMQVLEIRKKVLGEEHPDYAESLNIVGIAYGKMGDYQNALKYIKQAMAIRKKVLGDEHPDYAESLNTIGIAYDAMRDYKNALKYKIQGMEIVKKIIGEEHPVYATLLNNIGITYYAMGNYQNALKYVTQAMEIRRKVTGEENSDYAFSLGVIGQVYDNLGDYQNALKYSIQSMEINKKVLGEEHPDYASSLNDIGIVYCNMGDYENALKYQMQALEIRKKVLDENHHNYVMSLNNIGVVYSEMGDYQNALKYHTQALETMVLDSDKVLSLNNIGTVYCDMGDYQNALKYFTQASNIMKKIAGEELPDYAKLMQNIGSVYSNMGDYQNALKYHTQALEIRKKVLGENHHEYATPLNSISSIYLKTKDYANATKTNKRAFDIHKRSLINNFSFMTSHERETYWNANNKYFEATPMLVYYSPDDTLATRTSYDVELITKGLLLASEISMTNVIMESGNSALVSEYEEMRAMHLQLNKELERPIAERVYNCDSLEKEIYKMERSIVEKCKDFGDITNFIKIDWKDVQNSLKPNDVAIEFSNFTENDTTKFVALVLTKSMEAPACVPLFNQYDLQKLQRGVAPVKTETKTDDENRGATTVAAKRQGIYESTGLYNTLWKPLEKYFPENPRIYFAPSGMLHQIAIEYAPIGDSKLISDKYEIYRVSSTRFLAMDYMPKPMKNSVLYGGVYYDSDTTTMKRESVRYATRSASYSSFADFNKDEDHGSLNYLPGTKTEVEDIAGKMKGNNISTTLYEGSQANEESFKALSGSNISALHIATHGFFLPTDEKLSGDQSLIQSGLLLSGANLAWQNQPIPDGIEDGILTAKEISFMDLRKTDLVVLSACQTALGEITGEGVFGLQRGFKKAGARTLIMSLWPVDDNATLLMMTEFYSNLTNGMTKRDAFLAAQNKVKTTAGFENPRYWAAFIMLDGNEK